MHLSKVLDSAYRAVDVERYDPSSSFVPQKPSPPQGPFELLVDRLWNEVILSFRFESQISISNYAEYSF